MKKRSLQAIQDFWENLGYKGEKLRKMIIQDQEWQRIVKERKGSLETKIPLRKKEQKKYVLSTNEDYEILAKIKQLEKKQLSKEDKMLASLIRTQLEHDWRKSLIKILNKLLKKYKNI